MASFQHQSHSRGEAPTSYGGDDLFYMASVAQIEVSIAVTRGVTRASEPCGATVELDPHRGEAVSRMVTLVLGSPTFSANDLKASGVDLTRVFQLVATLYEHGSVVATSAKVCEGVDVGQLVVGDVVMEQPVVSGVDSPWQAAAAKMDALLARPAIDRERLTPGVCMLDNRSGIFWLVSPTGQVYKPDRILLDSGAQPLMLGKAACIGLGIRRSELELCPFQIQTSLGGATNRSNFMTRERLSVQMKSDHVTNSSRLGVTAVVTTAESYDVIVGGVVLYPMGFQMDYWTEIATYRPGDLLEGNISTIDTPVYKDIEEAWREVFVHVEEEEVPQRTPISGPVGLSPLDTTPIVWEYPSEGICMLDLFGGISTSLAAVLQVGILVRKYLYVERDETARRVSSHHLTLLMRRYPELLSRSVIQGYQRALPLDIALLGAQDLARIGPINLVIAGWPCQGHTRASRGEGLRDPQSRMFWEMLRVLRHLQTHQARVPAYILENVPLLGDTRSHVMANVHQIRSWIGPAVLLDAAKVVKVVDKSPMVVVNRVGQPRMALPTFVSFPASHAYREGGPGLVWDTCLQQLVEPNADERDVQWGFLQE
ncbi:unnamed protein product [Sphagnum troendelagicum]|uniref:DNA (cytosine-5-)-methyltransferase n=1 Tax=Sphagnum troendelagicum TaxID=128251 RepID=A0ABP0TWM0_9BRYO